MNFAQPDREAYSGPAPTARIGQYFSNLYGKSNEATALLVILDD